MSILTVLIGLILLSLAGLWAGLRTRSLRRRAAFIYAFAAVTIVLISLPLSVVVAWWVSPFWNRLGSVLGVRLVTHSGPVLWCYVAVFAMCVILLAGVGALLLRRVMRQSAGGGSDEVTSPGPDADR